MIRRCGQHFCLGSSNCDSSFGPWQSTCSEHGFLTLVNFDEWMKLIGLMVAGLTAIVGVVTVVTTILVNFGRRHRLRLAIDVRNGIPKDQQKRWDLMIFEDAANVMERADDEPIPVWVIYVIAWAFFAAGYLPFISEAVQTTLVMIGTVLTVTGGLVLLRYVRQRRRRIKRRNERLDEIEDRMDQRDQELDENERRLDEKESAISAREKRVEQLRRYSHRLASYHVYVFGAPMRMVRDARVDPIDATTLSILKHFDHPVWRLRASIRRRNVFGRRRIARLAHGLRPEDLQKSKENLVNQRVTEVARRSGSKFASPEPSQLGASAGEQSHDGAGRLGEASG
jgi:hypothetical protein